MFKTISIILVLSVAILASEIREEKSLAVTIYNNDFAMVKDVRQISFDQGTSELYFTDVAERIQPETVTFKPIDATGEIRVFEQNFEKNLINTQALLDRFIEKDIEVYVRLGDESKKAKGKYLGNRGGGYILETEFGLNVFNQIDGLEFSTLPEGFFTTPTLNWKVHSSAAESIESEVAYRTTGFSWKSDYSLVLNEEEDKADVGGWVTIDNQSGKKYKDAKLKLIAGDVNTVSNNNFQPQPVFARDALF